MPKKKNRKSIRKRKQKQKETAIQQIVNYYFYTKGLSLNQIKNNAKKRKIIYSRFTRPAKQLLELAGSIRAAKKPSIKWLNGLNPEIWTTLLKQSLKNGWNWTD